MAECGQRSMQRGVETVCVSPSGNHRFCSGWSVAEEGFVDWPNPHWTPPKARSRNATAQTIHTVAAKMRADTPPMS